MNIGHSSRLPYDNCAYPDRLKESTDPLLYRLSVNQIHNCNRCLNHNGAGPRTTGKGFGVSTLEGEAGYAPANDLVDVESVMSNRNVRTSKCKRGKLNPVNLTTRKAHNYDLCNNYTHPEFSKLSHPPSNYRDVAVNRFYNPLHDPQENIFYSFAHNSRLEAKDNYHPDLPEFWEDTVHPVEYKGPQQKCGISCQAPPNKVRRQ
jgi:hypothetical protein